MFHRPTAPSAGESKHSTLRFRDQSRTREDTQGRGESFILFFSKLKLENRPGPEATSYSRATSFNRFNTDTLFSNLAKVLERGPNPFEPKDLWNMDETGITTVQVPDRIVSKRGMKQLGAMTSAERGTLITMALAINAQGNCIPHNVSFPKRISSLLCWMVVRVDAGGGFPCLSKTLCEAHLSNTRVTSYPAPWQPQLKPVNQRHWFLQETWCSAVVFPPSLFTSSPWIGVFMGP